MRGALKTELGEIIVMEIEGNNERGRQTLRDSHQCYGGNGMDEQIQTSWTIEKERERERDTPERERESERERERARAKDKIEGGKTERMEEIMKSRE